MNGEVAQCIALVCYGNAFLGGQEVPDLLATNSSFQFCASITFQGPGDETPANPNLWLAALRDAGVYGLRLIQAARNDPKFSDRMTAGFSGGGSFWAIEAVRRDGTSDFYTSQWTVGDRDSPERRIWIVTYRKFVTQATTPMAARPLAIMTVVMTGALNQVHAFASSHKYCENFDALFVQALAALQGSAEKPVYHQDLFPAGSLSPDATNLLASCQAAWVFGGMGSWNDMGFDDPTDQPMYEGYSNYLYTSLTEAIPVAANDSFRPR